VRHPDGLRLAFELDAHAQETLVRGLDHVARTLTRAGSIEQYERDHTPRFDVRALAL